MKGDVAQAELNTREVMKDDDGFPFCPMSCEEIDNLINDCKKDLQMVFTSHMDLLKIYLRKFQMDACKSPFKPLDWRPDGGSSGSGPWGGGDGSGRNPKPELRIGGNDAQGKDPQAGGGGGDPKGLEAKDKEAKEEEEKEKEVDQKKVEEVEKEKAEKERAEKEKEKEQREKTLEAKDPEEEVAMAGMMRFVITEGKVDSNL